MRYRRRNPSTLTLVLIGGAVAIGAFFLLHKKAAEAAAAPSPSADPAQAAVDASVAAAVAQGAAQAAAQLGRGVPTFEDVSDPGGI